MARWTSDFDCGYDTQWWYEILDHPFDLSSLKAKRRYVVKKGMKHFDVKKVNTSEFARQIAEVAVAAVATYESPSSSMGIDNWADSAKSWDGDVFAAFPKEGGPMAAWALVKDHGSWVNLISMKANPAQEKNEVNAALLAGLVGNYADRLKGDFYICDGERSIYHQTSFQDYLEKYFCFRKAFCKLNVKFRFPVNVAVVCLRPFQKSIQKGKSAFCRKLRGVMLMDSIARGRTAE